MTACDAAAPAGPDEPMGTSRSAATPPEAAAAAEGTPAEQTAEETPKPATSTEPAPGQSATPPPVVEAAAPVVVGQDVEIIGTSLNGSVGVAVEFLETKGRWKVKFASETTKNFKPENLRAAKTIAPARASQKRPRHTQEAREEAAKQRPVEGRGGMQVGGSVSDLLERIRREPAGQGLAADEAEARPPVPKPEEPAAPAPSGEAPAATAKEAEAEAPPEAKPINLAGRKFEEKDDLIKHIREMQKKLDADANGGAGVLEAEDRLLVFHMFMRHPTVSQKFKAPVTAIRYGVHSLFPQSKCFILVFSDGTEEPVGWMKCVRELFALRQPTRGKRGRDAEGGEGEPVKSKTQRRRASPEPGQVSNVRGERCAAEESRQATGLRLLKEVAAEQKHPKAELWEYPLMDEARRCFAGYMKCPVEQQEQLQTYFKRVESGTTWMQPDDPRSGEPIPRKTAWMVSPGMTCTYRYGGVDVDPQEFPPWMYELMEVYMPICGLSSKEEWPNSCNLNLYEDGAMSVGWHSDDEKLFGGRFSRIVNFLRSQGSAELSTAWAGQAIGMADHEVTFVCDCKTDFGEVLLIVGSVPELGSWTASAGLVMLTDADGYPTWKSPPLTFSESSRSEVVEYKYVKAGPQGYFWEPGKNRTVVVGECKGADGESTTTTVHDGHFNISERGRESKGRVRRLKSIPVEDLNVLPETVSTPEAEATPTAAATQLPGVVTTPEAAATPKVEVVQRKSEEATPADGAAKHKSEEAKPADSAAKEYAAKKAEEQARKLAAEVEGLRSSREDAERLRSELVSERSDRARSRARNKERTRKVSEELESEASKAAELEAKLQTTMAANVEVEKLKTELERERRERASSRVRHRSHVKELERQAEERQAEERLAEERKAEELLMQQEMQQQQEVLLQALDSPRQEKARVRLLEDLQLLRDSSKETSKAAAAELQAVEALRQAQKQEFEAELCILEQGMAEGQEPDWLFEPESAKQAREARQQRRACEMARQESERQHQELTAEARRLRQRLRQLRDPPCRAQRPLLLGGAMLLLVASSFSTTQAARRVLHGGKQVGRWLLEKGDIAAGETAQLVQAGIASGYDFSTSAVQGGSDRAQRLWAWIIGRPRTQGRRRPFGLDMVRIQI